MDRWIDVLSPRTLQVLLLLGKHESYENVRKADPTITDQDISAAQAELLGALGLGDTIPNHLLQHALTSAKQKSRRTVAGKKSPSGAYQIKINLRGSKPSIWRRFIVPGSIRLDDLHHVVQDVMGWYDCHLHCFVIDGEEYVPTGGEFADLDMDGLAESKFRLCDLITEPKKRFSYSYDFGDGWDHSLTVEKIIPDDQNPRTMVCLAGKGRCPMEDCGGLWGWYHLLEVLNDPGHEEHASMKEWAGGSIDPDDFDPAAVTKSLGSMRLRKK